MSLEFSQTSAVPGEETTMQVMANPESLCGLSIVDKSVLVKEPGKILTADKVNTGIHFFLSFYCVPCDNAGFSSLKALHKRGNIRCHSQLCGY